MGHSKSAPLPKKPRPDFPLFVQGDPALPERLRWAKKVRGKRHYFGKCAGDPKGQAALVEWLRVKDDLLAGRSPRPKDEQGLTVAELCDRFVVSKDRKLEAGEVTKRTRDEAKLTCDRLVKLWGKTRLVSDLRAEDFDKLRQRLAKRLGPTSLGNEIQRVRSVFKYGYDAALLSVPQRFGAEFKRPSKKVLRLARQAKGPKLIAAADIRKLIDAADIHVKAMILLAINCGYGNADCGTLPIDKLDVIGGWVNYGRPKTGIARRCKLWPETIEALRASLAKRPLAKSDDAEKLVFVTKYGASWAKNIADNPVAKEFAKLAKSFGIRQPGATFYSLRHVFRTVASGARDLEATRAIMGHVNEHVEDAYIERIDDDRLEAVADHVRAWLYARPVEHPQSQSVTERQKARATRQNHADNRSSLRVVG